MSQDDPSACRKNRYNFERQAPRLYREQKVDSLLGMIEFIKTDCGSGTSLEITRLLVMSDQGRFENSLIGASTIPQMLWHRNRHERLQRRSYWADIYRTSKPTDSIHDDFVRLKTDVARQVSSGVDLPASAKALGLYYSGAFDSALSIIQSDELRGTELRKRYDDFVSQTKDAFPVRRHYSIFVGSWSPRGNARLLGNHPEIGFQLGREGNKWRADLIFSYRFSPPRNRFTVNRFGQRVSTADFNSLRLGVEAGYKFIDSRAFSSDLFVSLGYDEIYNLDRAGGPAKSALNGTLGTSVGLRQRVFLDQRSGFYLGTIIRYGVVDYGNPRGTDLSGNTLSVALVTGWSIHETLKQFLRKLNFKGSWRK